MYCEKCGKEMKDNQQFCTNCGNQITNNNESLGTASMVIGIISLILTFIFSVMTLPLSITGLILGIINKAKKGKKISGIILNGISIVLSFVIIFILIVLGFSFIEFIFNTILDSPKVRKEINNIYNDINKDYNDDYNYDYDTDEDDEEIDEEKTAVIGKYNCSSFDGTGPSKEYIVRLELNKDDTFLWGKYGDTSKNYVKGIYDVKDLEKTNYSGNYKYYEVDLDGEEYYEDGIKQTEPYESTYEFGITSENGKKQGIIMNTKTQNMYYCYEE